MTSEERRLRDQLDMTNARIEALERENREREERAQRDHERRRRERDEELKAAMRQADDWPEAFRKQRRLIGPELAFSRKNLAETEADGRFAPEEKEQHLEFWRDDVANLQADLESIDAAEQIYAEEAKKAQVELDAVRKRILAAVVGRLRERGAPRSRGFLTDLLECLEADDPSRWLNW
jgi:hypothetical protein